MFVKIWMIEETMIKKEKIRELWKRISQEIRNVFKKYPFTITITILLTILCIIFINESSGFILDYLNPFLGWFGVGLFFCESGFGIVSRPPFKIIGIFISAAISAFLVYQYSIYYENNENYAYYIPNDIWFERIKIAYIIVCLILGIYFCYRKSGSLLPHYGIRVFSNLVKINIIYMILSIGALTIGIIVQELFFSDNYSLNIIGRMMILVVGFFYVPSIIYCFSEVNISIDSFTKILVKYVLFPLTMLIFVIIYIYVIKILILRDIPSNQIFSILTGLFILAAPTWTMMESFEQEYLWYYISRKIPLLFIPLILLQTYSVGIRIKQYGITPDRYMGVMWIILEIIYLIIYFKIHRYAGRIFVVIAIFTITALLLPYINMYSVSISSQEKILSIYRKGGELSEESEKKIYGAFEYLQDVQNSEKYLEEKYTEEEIEEISGFYNEMDDRYYSPEIRIGIDSYVDDFDISKYSKMQIVQYDMNYNDPLPNLKKLKLTKRESKDEVITVNLEKIIGDYVDYGLQHIEKDEYYVSIDSYYTEHYQVNFDDDKALIIKNFEIKYNKETEKVEYLDLTAYLFQ